MRKHWMLRRWVRAAVEWVRQRQTLWRGAQRALVRQAPVQISRPPLRDAIAAVASADDPQADTTPKAEPLVQLTALRSAIVGGYTVLVCGACRERSQWNSAVESARHMHSKARRRNQRCWHGAGMLDRIRRGRMNVRYRNSSVRTWSCRKDANKRSS